MRHLLTILAAVFLCAPAQAQTLKALMYNTTNGRVVAATNVSFTNPVGFSTITASTFKRGTNFSAFIIDNNINGYFQFQTTNTNDGSIRLTHVNPANLNNVGDIIFGIRTGDAFLQGTSTNVRIEYSGGMLNRLLAASLHLKDDGGIGQNNLTIDGHIVFNGTNSAAATRTNLGLGSTNSVTFAGLTNNGDITINGTTATNGLLFICRTNNEAFLGMANLIASNNTAISNETLFRVGVAEATNRSAQFGFRTVRTNNGGEGFATFSVFGYNALMMIGPSDRSRTNTATNAGIEADIWTITPTNRVMTLRDTNTGALTMHQDLGFGAGLTNTAPNDTTNPAVWMRVWVGTNSYRVPLYQ